MYQALGGRKQNEGHILHSQIFHSSLESEINRYIYFCEDNEFACRGLKAARKRVLDQAWKWRGTNTTSSRAWCLTWVIKDKQELARPSVVEKKKGCLRKRDAGAQKQGK